VPPTPGRRPYEHEVVKKWTAEIARADGFIIVTPEYNYAPPQCSERTRLGLPRVESQAGCLRELGARSALAACAVAREAIELQMAPIRHSVHIPVATLWAHFQGGDVEAGLAQLDAPAKTMIDDLVWWTAALKSARVP
jgi:NAD(P)H-dependent FMN reductase